MENINAALTSQSEEESVGMETMGEATGLESDQIVCVRLLRADAHTGDLKLTFSLSIKLKDTNSWEGSLWSSAGLTAPFRQIGAKTSAQH